MHDCTGRLHSGRHQWERIFVGGRGPLLQGEMLLLETSCLLERGEHRERCQVLLFDGNDMGLTGGSVAVRDIMSCCEMASLWKQTLHHAMIYHALGGDVVGGDALHHEASCLRGGDLAVINRFHKGRHQIQSGEETL